MNPQDIAQATGDDAGLIALYWPLLVAGMVEFGIYRHWVEVGLAATVATECDFRYLTELASGEDYNGRADLGNTQPGDGPRFRGRGFIQETGRGGYWELGQALGVDLIADPEMAADPKIAGRGAAWWFLKHGVAAACDRQDKRMVRLIVNGGYNGWDRFSACWDALARIPDTHTTVITLGLDATLRQIPSGSGRAAIGPDGKNVQMHKGDVVHFTPDPHTGKETTPHWAHIHVDKSPAHGWLLRAALVRTDS